MNIRKLSAGFLSTAALMLLLAMLPAATMQAQHVIRVTGKVISKDKRKPQYGVNVTDERTKQLLASTDEDGRFVVSVRDNGTLRFTMVGAEPAIVKVRKHTYIEVELENKDFELEEALVKAKRKEKTIQPEPTDIEIVGNWAKIKTVVRVPHKLFRRDTRLVVQPVLNNLTKKKESLMRPMVYDAREYNQTQDRMYNFKMEEGDPLARFVTVRHDSLEEKREGDGAYNDILPYVDSLYLEDVRDEFTCDVYTAIEDYRRIIYRDTSIIARGTVRPLRWLEYNIGAEAITDAAYFPKAEKQLHDSRGEVNLVFPIGKAIFDEESEQNKAELAKMEEQLRSIRETPDAKLLALRISGTSSPDGRYELNKQLAQKRMEYALSVFKSHIDEDTRKDMEFASEADVATWEEVVALLRTDTLHKEAEQIENLIKQHSKSIDDQGKAIRRLPFYRDILEAKYLPRLRRVEYNMEYSIYRELTLDEIKALYEKDYKQLSRFEFFQLYRNEPDEGKREQIIRQALEISPSFMVAANDLQVILLNQHRPDPDLLKPFASQKAPIEVNINHAIALLETGRYEEAAELMDSIPRTEQTDLLHAVSGAMTGNLAGNYESIAQTSPRNRVAMLLAMKRNKEALDYAMMLDENEAVSHYLRAVCLNRLEKPVEAGKELNTAIKMDPSLKATAYIDGDVNGLLLGDKRYEREADNIKE